MGRTSEKCIEIPDVPNPETCNLSAARRPKSAGGSKTTQFWPKATRVRNADRGRAARTSLRQSMLPNPQSPSEQSAVAGQARRMPGRVRRRSLPPGMTPPERRRWRTRTCSSSSPTPRLSLLPPHWFSDLAKTHRLPRRHRARTIKEPAKSTARRTDKTRQAFEGADRPRAKNARRLCTLHKHMPQNDSPLGLRRNALAESPVKTSPLYKLPGTSYEVATRLPPRTMLH